MRGIKSNGWTVNFNSDMSGDVVFVAPDGTGHAIPGDVLIDVVAEHIRQRRIVRTESASVAHLLGIEDQ